jgi:hypothetical protein
MQALINLNYAKYSAWIGPGLHKIAIYLSIRTTKLNSTWNQFLAQKAIKRKSVLCNKFLQWLLGKWYKRVPMSSLDQTELQLFNFFGMCEDICKSKLYCDVRKTWLILSSLRFIKYAYLTNLYIFYF